jgi:phage/plasmid-associated DNA primase
MKTQTKSMGCTLVASSDAAIARHLFEGELSGLIYDEGSFWLYERTHWQAISTEAIQCIAMRYDQQKVSGDTINLSKGRLSSIAECLRLLAMRPGFFEELPRGINCASGFISFGEDSTPTLLNHSLEHKQRHVLPGEWNENSGPVQIPETSILWKLLDGCFPEGGEARDPEATEKYAWGQEIAGCAAIGAGTQYAKAILLHGPQANNGKSQFLDMVRGLLPDSAISEVSPRNFGKDHHLIGLVGALLNASDEVGAASAIMSEIFKQVIDGNLIRVADKYEKATRFRPTALHIFSCNRLPKFGGEMDRGVRRRLAVFQFDRVIPDHEQIKNIGLRIAREEADMLLAWAVEGAQRLLANNGFTLPESSREAVNEWGYLSDPVQAFVADCVRPAPQVVGEDRMPKKPKLIRYKEIRDKFAQYLMKTGRDMGGRFEPGMDSVIQRLRENLPRGAYRDRDNTGWGFRGIKLVDPPQDEPSKGDNDVPTLGEVVTLQAIVS